MEIRQVLRGNQAGFASARPSKAPEAKAAGPGRADRVELSREWAERMEEQQAQTQAALLAGKQEKKSSGILDMLDGPDSEELDAQMKALRAQQKCMEISRRIMAGKRVPPEDEQYLMEHDPEGYKLTMAMRKPSRDDEECESVLDEEDRSSGETSETGEAAPAESGGDGPSSGGEA